MQAAASATTTEWPAGLVKIADGLDHPSDLAITSDSRVWIAERAGRVRVVRDGALVRNPVLTLDRRLDESLVSLTPDPHFDMNHFMFAIYTERSRSGQSFVIARFREASDTLADRVIILDRVAASSNARASLRFGLDGKLYAAFDDGGSTSLAEDPASFNGKLLRLNADGTTPDDAPRKSPIVSAGAASPRGLAWHRATARLWAADTSTLGGIRWPSSIEAVAILNDDLLVASGMGLSRAHIQRGGTLSLGAVRDVLRNVSIRAAAAAPDGTIYVATDTAVGRLQ
jgi:glucose/arabinose dehydrogenase